MQDDTKFTIELDRQQFGLELSEQVGWALDLEPGTTILNADVSKKVVVDC